MIEDLVHPQKCPVASNARKPGQKWPGFSFALHGSVDCADVDRRRVQSGWLRSRQLTTFDERRAGALCIIAKFRIRLTGP